MKYLKLLLISIWIVVYIITIGILSIFQIITFKVYKKVMKLEMKLYQFCTNGTSVMQYGAFIISLICWVIWHIAYILNIPFTWAITQLQQINKKTQKLSKL